MINQKSIKMIELYIFWNNKSEGNNSEIQKVINQNYRYFEGTNLFVSKPENTYNAIDIGAGCYGMSK